MEMDIAAIQNFEEGGFLTLEDKEKINTLELCKNKFLKEQEEVWRLKSMEIWLESGDENT